MMIFGVCFVLYLIKLSAGKKYITVELLFTNTCKELFSYLFRDGKIYR